MNSNQKLLVLPYFIVGTFLSLPFLTSGRFSFLIVLISLVLSLFLFIAVIRSEGIPKVFPNKVLVVFFVALGLLSIFSIQPVRSVPVIIWWLIFLAIFLFSSQLSKGEGFLTNISKFFVSVTVIFSLVSIYNFVQIGLTSYTRLEGFIGAHNVYGGFLIIPLLLSIYLAFQAERKWGRVVWLIASAVLISSFILTFSRGSWVSIIAALLIVTIAFRKRIKNYFYFVIPAKAIQQNRADGPGIQDVKVGSSQIIKKAIGLILLTAILTSGIWFSAKQVTIKQDSAKISQVAVFPMQNRETNAVTARLHYYEDAWNTFLERPLTGFGAGNYASALRMYKTDPDYGSFADPHNWLLKMLVENGLLVTIIFLTFIVSLFWRLRSLILAGKKFDWLAAAIFTGLLGGTIHGLMDFDWSVNGFLLVYFLFAGLLYGYCMNDSDKPQRTVQYFPRWFSYLLVFLIIGGAVVSIQILRADLVRAKGDVYFFDQKDPDSAINSYFESLTINKYESKTWYSLWRAYFLTQNYNAARNCIDKAIALFPTNGSYYLALAVTDEAVGNVEGYRANLLKAIEYFPGSDLNALTRLVELDFKQGKYDEAIFLMNEVMPIYEKYEKALWFRNDPNSVEISRNLVRLREIKGEIEKKTAL